LADTVTPANCAGGSFRGTTGGASQDNCTACPQGQYCVAGATAPANCGAGNYQAQTGHSTCDVCPAGQYCADAATVTPTNCVAGSYRFATGGASADDCTTCPAGKRCGAGATAATECGAGYFQPQTGQSACIECLEGQFCADAATITPTLCAAGTFRAGLGGTAQADCAKCATGTFDATTLGRSTECPPCAVGHYCLSPTAQAACPSNTNSTEGSSSQLGCRCLAGYVCSYKKLIMAVVTLNSTTVADFNANVNGVQTTFIASVAASAGLSSAQVTIVSVKPHGAGRRLLSELVDVYTHIEGAMHLTQLSQHMARRGMLVESSDWTVAHTARTRALP
jgi:hypothetical protein